MFIQCWYRRRFARRAAAATKLQAALRMRYASCSFWRIRSSILIIQVSTLHASCQDAQGRSLAYHHDRQARRHS